MSVSTLEAPVHPEASRCNGESLYEVVDGHRVELPPTSTLANRTAGELYLHLATFVKRHGLGRANIETLFIIDPRRDLRRRPDVSFVSNERWPPDRAVPNVGDWHVVPDLAVEVISPNDLFHEVIAKMREYFRYDVRQVWLVLPNDQEVHIHQKGKQPFVLTMTDELDGGEQLAGFRLPLATLFQESTLAEAAKP
jgi:Uma2 family endonuclease